METLLRQTSKTAAARALFVLCEKDSDGIRAIRTVKVKIAQTRDGKLPHEAKIYAQTTSFIFSGEFFARLMWKRREWPRGFARD